MGDPLRIGVVGCGVISSAYLETAGRVPDLEVVAVADADPTRARHAADTHALRAVSLDELWADDEIEWVLDLTTPGAHAEVALTALESGFSVYNEKPLCATTADARQVLDAAADAGLAVGSAPDTVLGTGIQTARAALEAGAIGRPVAATATMACAGHELWHPHPDFYYAPGGGPLFDMGPYYLTALVHLLGPVESVQAVARRPRDVRTIASGPRAGTEVPVEVATHVTALVEHASGTVSTLVMSFDAPSSRAMPIEVHGEEGSMVVPDPNTFDGAVEVRATEGDWTTVPVRAGYPGAARGFGLVDVARSGDRRTGRASAEVALHVLDVMECVVAAAEERRRVDVASTCLVPPLVPLTG
ncbi:Gfo/Idh/MocA family protein [Isoptericola croceus]|uniref:Gfo/Idh/MocA family protein n=1 Tax=Isoptericola croceus TaxID=3031406 RepID=UPI0023F8541F|nr:Gfo/Idh/MocA family oxidoreductase [Isoptericola croceus]